MKKAGEGSSDLKYWQERGAQIEWRLGYARAKVREMEKDLAECDQMIRNLKELQKEGEGE